MAINPSAVRVIKDKKRTSLRERLQNKATAKARQSVESVRSDIARRKKENEEIKLAERKAFFKSKKNAAIEQATKRGRQAAVPRTQRAAKRLENLASGFANVGRKLEDLDKGSRRSDSVFGPPRSVFGVERNQPKLSKFQKKKKKKQGRTITIRI